MKGESMTNTKELINYIILEISSYKLYKALLEQTRLEDVGVDAQKYYETPRSITNRFFSVTENLALYKRDEMSLIRSIKQVDNWLQMLDDDERHVTYNFYVNNRTYNTIANIWNSEHKVYYSLGHWKKKRKAAINKICQLF
jgi:hypothetical protein